MTVYARCRSKENFYPRPPRGGRQLAVHAVGAADEFLSTSSARRTTGHDRAYTIILNIFLSTSSARRTTRCLSALHSDRGFLSTSSARRTTGVEFEVHCSSFISIHVLREEDDIQPDLLGS